MDGDYVTAGDHADVVPKTEATEADGEEEATGTDDGVVPTIAKNAAGGKTKRKTAATSPMPTPDFPPIVTVVISLTSS